MLSNVTVLANSVMASTGRDVVPPLQTAICGILVWWNLQLSCLRSSESFPVTKDPSLHKEHHNACVPWITRCLNTTCIKPIKIPHFPLSRNVDCFVVHLMVYLRYLAIKKVNFFQAGMRCFMSCENMIFADKLLW